jgi:hypothetical protein
MDPVYSVMIGLTCLVVGYVVAKVSLGLTIQKRLDDAERELAKPTIMGAYATEKSLNERCTHYWVAANVGGDNKIHLRLTAGQYDEAVRTANTNKIDNPFTK